MATKSPVKSYCLQIINDTPRLGTIGPKTVISQSRLAFQSISMDPEQKWQQNQMMAMRQTRKMSTIGHSLSTSTPIHLSAMNSKSRARISGNSTSPKSPISSHFKHQSRGFRPFQQKLNTSLAHIQFIQKNEYIQGICYKPLFSITKMSLSDDDEYFNTTQFQADLRDSMDEPVTARERNPEWEVLLNLLESRSIQANSVQLADDYDFEFESNPQQSNINKSGFMKKSDQSFEDIVCPHPNDTTFLREDSSNQLIQAIPLETLITKVENQVPQLPLILQPQQIQSAIVQQSAIEVTTCQCVKIKCSKSYCSCFGKGRLCGPNCSCQNCENRGITITKKQRKQVTFLDKLAPQQKGCKCQKNNCLKRYCECRNKGLECSPNCQCLNCKNKLPPVQRSLIRRVSDSSDLDQTIQKLPCIRKKIRKIKGFCIKLRSKRL